VGREEDSPMKERVVKMEGSSAFSSKNVHVSTSKQSARLQGCLFPRGKNPHLPSGKGTRGEKVSGRDVVHVLSALGEERLRGGKTSFAFMFQIGYWRRRFSHSAHVGSVEKRRGRLLHESTMNFNARGRILYFMFQKKSNDSSV